MLTIYKKKKKKLLKMTKKSTTDFQKNWITHCLFAQNWPKPPQRKCFILATRMLIRYRPRNGYYEQLKNSERGSLIIHNPETVMEKMNKNNHVRRLVPEWINKKTDGVSIEQSIQINMLELQRFLSQHDLVFKPKLTLMLFNTAFRKLKKFPENVEHPL